MRLVSAEEMRAVDRYAIDALGIPALVLMENAGRAVADEVIRFEGGRSQERRRRNGAAPRWIVLVGKGNNGGDGIVCARHLADAGYDVLLLYAEQPDGWGGEAGTQRDIARRIGIPSAIYGTGEPVAWEAWDGIVDALLGTGASGAPREPYAALIREASASGLPVVAVDLPSGLNADTGEALDPCFRARITVALAAAKRGLSQHPGVSYAGEVVVRPIGIPEIAFRHADIRTFRLDAETMRSQLGLAFPPERPADAHKGTFGHALIAAGSREMSGAGLLCAKAALRSGCGLVSWAVPEGLSPALAGRLPEALLRTAADGGSGDWRMVPAERLAELAAGKQAMVIGPGMGRWPGDSAWLRELWDRLDTALVLDADALNMLAEAGEPFLRWPRKETPVVLTPHPGEMARLCGLSAKEVQRDRIESARRFAAAHGVTLVLKGAGTVVAAPDGRAFVNPTGNPGMATGGSGDVLAGLIGGLLAQGLDGPGAAAAGTYAHGAAGDRAAAARFSPGSLIAGDIVDAL
ncbi:NAD(P)H-hydrate dehydratase [Cohnella caldifontis]|uniref:NAD(P)H-hydrate dehydratase n=1 Tax=Cohnella caldifontis TaxID=3027471 RepID=UPI0023EA8036|nr:NAD(P)H-hydrate dehydratase [Cohnella sp. YIM B05605]